MATKSFGAALKLSDAERAAKAIGTTFASIVAKIPADAKAGENFAAVWGNLSALADIVLQRGDGQGKRIRGAKSHAAADQIAAVVDTVRRGSIVSAE